MSRALSLFGCAMARAGISLVLASCLMPGIAKAQQNYVPAARVAVQQADHAWDRGEYALSLRLFSNAYAIVKAPTIAVRQAECLEKLGRLVEALDVYETTSRMQLDSAAPEPFKVAVATSLARAGLLRDRIPTMFIHVYGDNVDGVDVVVDGKPIPKGKYTSGFLIDPGEHVIKVIKGDRWGRTKARVDEGERKRVHVYLPNRSNKM